MESDIVLSVLGWKPVLTKLMVKNVYQSFDKVKKWKTDISDKCLGITKGDIFMYLAQRVKTFQSI